MSGCPFLLQHEQTNMLPTAASNTNNTNENTTTNNSTNNKLTTSSSSDSSSSSPTASTSIQGFQVATGDFLTSKKSEPPCHYSSYLATTQLLALQDGHAACKPNKQGMMHHEENTFIIVHQVQELWMKLLFIDLTKVRQLMGSLWECSSGNEYHKRVAETLHYLDRAGVLLEQMRNSFDVIETMHSSDFLEFRDYLMPASGFQSVMFRRIEQLLGMGMEGRAEVNGQDVFSYLKQEEQAELAAQRAEVNASSLSRTVVQILCRLTIPENFERVFLDTVRKVMEEQQYDIAKVPQGDPKAAAHIDKAVQNVKMTLDDPVAFCENLFLEREEDVAMFKQALMGALFAVIYRHDPKYAALGSLLDKLVSTEHGLLLWRSRHLHMAERMIGARIGTGGAGWRMGVPFHIQNRGQGAF